MGDDSESSSIRAGRKTAPKKRAPSGKSPPRPTRPPSRQQGPPGRAPTSPTRPSPASSQGSRKNTGPPRRPPGGGGRGGGSPVPKGSGKPVQNKQRTPRVNGNNNNNNDGGGAEESDKFDLEGLNNAPTSRSGGARLGRPGASKGSTRSNNSKDSRNSGKSAGSGGGGKVSGRSPTSIRTRLRQAAAASFRKKSQPPKDRMAVSDRTHDRARGVNTKKNNKLSKSTHDNEEGAIVPVEDSDNFESFHGDVNQSAIVPSGGGGGSRGGSDDYDNGDEFDDNYDESQLPRPRPGMAREDSEVGEFPNDKWWQSCLRHFRILSPHPQEDELKRKIRYLIWTTLVLDVLVAIVSIATFGDGVTSCCGTAVMAAGVSIDWDLFMKVITWIYLVGIFLEIHPVVREGPIPWNLLNPAFGFLISFAVFVDDSKAEAISIWILELSSVVLELVTYRLLRQVHNRKVKRLEELEDDIARERYSMGYKKTTFYRERRETRLVVSESEKKLRYHFIGATVNAGLVSITLLLIIFVARGGGLCLVGGQGPTSGLDIFNPDQKSRCNLCGDMNGFTDKCRICYNEGTVDEKPNQCYFPYF